MISYERNPLWTQAEVVAAQMGVYLALERAADGVFSVYASRGEDAGGWTLARTKIALGRDPEVVAQTTLAALRKIAPQIAKKVADDAPPETAEDMVRLHPDDIEAIGEAVAAAQGRIRLATIEEARAALDGIGATYAVDHILDEVAGIAPRKYPGET